MYEGSAYLALLFLYITSSVEPAKSQQHQLALNLMFKHQLNYLL